ncbi:MAG: hypothetical protein GY697_17730, partial [Desulfobacterales bacterium]|nr:hypothetical protein [Desulfobacterales bacterium]
TEVVLTFPLRAFYAADGDLDRGNPEILLDIHDRNGNGDVRGARLMTCIPLVTRHCRGNWTTRADIVDNALSVNVLSFGDLPTEAGSVKTSEILGEEYKVFFPDEVAPSIPDEGSFWIGIEVPLNVGLESNSMDYYSGVPVFGTVLQRYTNGVLKDAMDRQIRANYGNTFELSRN